MPTPTAKSRCRKETRNSPPVRTRRKIVPDGLTEPIDFVNHPLFSRRQPKTALQRLFPLDDEPEVAPPTSAPGLVFVAGFVSQPLLRDDQEKALFAWMNFHRFRAERLRRALLKTGPCRAGLRELQAHLRQSLELRNRLVTSNLRLVISVAHKLTRSLDQLSELISEGAPPLIRAVELFDVSLGHRFSTYATWAIRNQLLRQLHRARRPVHDWRPLSETALAQLPAEEVAPTIADESPASAHIVERLLDELPDRERLVLEARFGLNGEPAGQSLAEVADRVGLSKERVRQIVLQSLEHLRAKVACVA